MTLEYITIVIILVTNVIMWISLIKLQRRISINESLIEDLAKTLAQYITNPDKEIQESAYSKVLKELLYKKLEELKEKEK